MRQLSRPDKSGNSRFEYTKILNTAHAGPLSGLAPLRTKYPICVILSYRAGAGREIEGSIVARM